MTKRAQARFVSFINKLARLLNIISCAGLVALMLLVTGNVISRSIFGHPLAGAYDISGFLAIIIIGFALAYCTVQDGHIEIAYFLDKAGRKTKRTISLAGDLFSAALLAVYTYALLKMAGRLQKTAELSVTTKTPLFIFVYLLAFCFAVLALAVLAKSFTKSWQGEEK